MGIERHSAGQAYPEQQRTRLIEDIYSTVADPGAWHGFLRDLIACTNSRSARMLVMNSQANRVLSSIKQNIDDNYHRQYTEHYVNACPWRPELVQKRPGRLYSTYLHFGCRQADFIRSEFYNDWAGPQDIHHGVCGTIYHDTGRTVQLLVQRTRGQGHYTEQETAFFNDFVPHLQHSFLLAGQIAGRSARAEAIAIAAGDETLPFLLLDFTLRPIYCNPGAEALISTDTTLTLANGQLRVADGSRNQRLQRLLRECLAAADSRAFHSAGGILEVPRPNRASLQLLVRPIHPDIPVLAATPAGYVAVYVYDPEAGIAIDRERLSRLYALSEAEIRVAVAMLETPDPAEVARRCFISLHTVRSHLKAIFAKTDTQGQADLMKRLLVGPARRR
jgi:DNA-binding CsgD family transcriptional regulator